MTKSWLVAFFVAGVSSGQAFADCVPSPDTPASVIEYFQKFNKPLPEQFCVKENAPHASEGPSQESPQAYEDAPEASPLDGPVATTLRYPLSTRLFQRSRDIPLLPMACGLATLNFAQSISGLSGSIRAWLSRFPFAWGSHCFLA